MAYMPSVDLLTLKIAAIHRMFDIYDSFFFTKKFEIKVTMTKLNER